MYRFVIIVVIAFVMPNSPSVEYINTYTHTKCRISIPFTLELIDTILMHHFIIILVITFPMSNSPIVVYPCSIALTTEFFDRMLMHRFHDYSYYIFNAELTGYRFINICDSNVSILCCEAWPTLVGKTNTRVVIGSYSFKI